MRYSVKKAEKLRKELHHEVREKGKPVVYPPRQGMESAAAAAWAMTGVCPECSHRSVTVGRCIMCGWNSKTVEHDNRD